MHLEEVVPLKVLGFDDENRLVTATLVDALEDAERNGWELDEYGDVVSYPDTVATDIKQLREEFARRDILGLVELQRRHEEDEVFEAKVTGSNRRGLLVNVEGVNASVPFSEIAEITDDPEQAIAQRRTYEGRQLRLKVIEIDHRRNRVILSERAAESSDGPNRRDHLQDELDEDDIRSRRTVAHDELDPVAAAMRDGDVVPAVITRVDEDAAHAIINGGREVRIALADLAEEEFNHAADVVGVGEVVPLKLLGIDTERHLLTASRVDALEDAERNGWELDEDGCALDFPDDVAAVIEQLREEADRRDIHSGSRNDHGSASLDLAVWHELQRRYDEGEVFEAKVTGSNKGGLLVNIKGIGAFVPLSQIAEITGDREQLPTYEGRNLRLKVIEVNRHLNRVILSERAVIEGWSDKQLNRLLDELHEGEIRSGQITRIRPNGVFVNLGGAGGLAHLSELSWERDIDPAEMFSIGQTVNAYVMKIDKEAKKINLSIRRAAPEQWDEAAAKFSVGQIVPVTVTKLFAFGAFVRIEGPLEGLIRVSELAVPEPAHPGDIVEEGDVLPVSIIRIDHDQKRINLSLKQAREEAEEMGWVFDSVGGIAEVPVDVAEQFGFEGSDDERSLENSG